MVGVSGVRDRQVDLIKKDGYEVVVFGGWPNWEKYFGRYLEMELEDKDGNIIELRPEYQWQWKQNYPELIAEDVANGLVPYSYSFGSEDVKDWVYGDLLYRGVNKWLTVRYFLVRYKKWVAEERDRAYKEMDYYKQYWDLYRYRVRRHGLGYVPFQSDVESAYRYGYWKGYYEAMRKVRADLKTMAMTPRYVVWNHDRPGFIVDMKISRGWLGLVKRLYSIRFEK